MSTTTKTTTMQTAVVKRCTVTSETAMDPVNVLQVQFVKSYSGITIHYHYQDHYHYFVVVNSSVETTRIQHLDFC